MKLLKELWRQIRLTFDPVYNDRFNGDHTEITNLPVGVKMDYEK